MSLRSSARIPIHARRPQYSREAIHEWCAPAYHPSAIAELFPMLALQRKMKTPLHLQKPQGGLTWYVSRKENNRARPKRLGITRSHPPIYTRLENKTG